MPLKRITAEGYVRNVPPKSMEKNDYFKILRSRLHPATFDRIVKTIEEAVDAKVDANSRLIWTKAGELFGYKSDRPLKDVQHMWDKIIEVVGCGKPCLMAVGVMLCWVISQRSEDWCSVKKETENVDEETDEFISITEYWIPEKMI